MQKCMTQLREAKKHETIVEGQRLRTVHIMERTRAWMRGHVLFIFLYIYIYIYIYKFIYRDLESGCA